MHTQRLGLALLITHGLAACAAPDPSAVRRLPTSPTSVTTVPLTITNTSPATGLYSDTLTITGTGFKAGAFVKLDSMPAPVTSFSGTAIVVTVPPHAAGKADVVVANLDGGSATLNGGYTYETVSMTSAPNRVPVGGELKVNWLAPAGRSRADWIALFRVGGSSDGYYDWWWKYTDGATSGSLTLNAPTSPGEYEFRYFVNDSYFDAGRSGQVIVGAQK